MLDKCVEANPTNKHKRKAFRMKYDLIAQPDKAFQPIIQRAIDTGQDMQAFVKSLKGVEDGLIRKSKPFAPKGTGESSVYRGIKGGIMEGHHGMATSTLSRLDRILKQRGGIARALRIVGIARSKGATPGTLGKHLYMMGQSTHRSGATIPVDQLSAHENPVKKRINPKTGEPVGVMSNADRMAFEKKNYDNQKAQTSFPGWKGSTPSGIERTVARDLRIKNKNWQVQPKVMSK